MEDTLIMNDGRIQVALVDAFVMLLVVQNFNKQDIELVIDELEKTLIEQITKISDDNITLATVFNFNIEKEKKYIKSELDNKKQLLFEGIDKFGNGLKPNS